MEQSYEEVLGQLLMRFANGVDAAVEFSKDQIPDLIQQLLAWKMVWAWVWIIVGVLFGLYMIYCIIQMRKITNPSESDTCVYVLQWCFLFISFTVILVNLHDILMIHFAPKLYVLEYASDLLNPSDK